MCLYFSTCSSGMQILKLTWVLAAFADTLYLSCDVIYEISVRSHTDLTYYVTIRYRDFYYYSDIHCTKKRKDKKLNEHALPIGGGSIFGGGVGGIMLVVVVEVVVIAAIIKYNN